MSRRCRTAITLLVVLGVLIALLVAVVVVFTRIPNHQPLPGEQRCVFTANGRSAAIDTEQAHYASIIAGVSVRRGLPARAASIALATAYQESNIRNLDHGDRDSVGLFQQRPSQGWGSKKKLMDPYYATNRFYRALVKIDDWEHSDITEIAQQIQISGFPEAYRDHEADARVLASVLTGHSPAGIECLIREPGEGDAVGLTGSLRKTFKIEPDRTGGSIAISAESTELAWAYAQYAVANARDYGVREVRIGSKQWTTDDSSLAGWTAAHSPINSRSIKIITR
ncbi:hypothetical protein [Microlunatus soli]|uniref:Uncharacterized protein n=1 Tax=Microlunatus soli TaxID=630515 RepID=A0A1H1Q8Z2_9ACTN|nr:hypothetical protein [Microlunatus soli]SDS19895.1 hypothetical protein SAMN04489812_1182 [Microlunatus soli]